MIVKEYKS